MRFAVAILACSCANVDTAMPLRRANWQLNEPRITEIFGCPLCHAEYKIIRRQTAPGIKPQCDECEQEFLPRDRDEWLVYERVDALS